MKVLQLLGISTVVFCISTSSAHALEFVNNGGFETGDFSGWTQSGNTGYTGVTSSTYNSGTYSGSFGPVGSLGYLSQSLATTPNQTYTLSYFLANAGGSGNQFQVAVGGNVLFDQTDIPAQPFTNYTFNFVATSSSTLLEFGFRNDPSYVYLDDVSVQDATAVPWEFSPELGMAMGMPLFLGLRSLRKRMAVKARKIELNGTIA